MRPDGAIYQDLLLRTRKGDADRIASAALIPFGPGCTGFVKTAAGILLASLFGRGREARVQRAIHCLDAVVEIRQGFWCRHACSANILRAYAFHPDAARGRGMAKAVRTLRRIQTPSGSWPGIPFAATFSALAHLDSRDAKAQVKKALPLVVRTQNADGTWGRGPRRELMSFQVVQAIRRIEA